MPDIHRLLFLDGETYYDDEYSLRQMTPAEYILDDKFELQMMGVKEGNSPPYIVDGPDFPKWVAEAQASAKNTATVTFNSLFDNSLMAWRFGYTPGLMIDALGMSRVCLGHCLDNLRLETVARHLRLGQKGDTLASVKGMRRAEIIRAGLWEKFCEYTLQDVHLTAGIFARLSPHIPEPERRLMDLVLRCTIEPGFCADKRLLLEHYTRVRDSKIDALADAQRALFDAGVMFPEPNETFKKRLRSDAKLEELLELMGIEIEYKTTKAGNVKPAFAKTDDFMIELEDHPEDAVRLAIAARLGLKSTLEETRSKRLLAISVLPWERYLGGKRAEPPMPIPLRFWGAHTGRLSGDWKMNMQNLPSRGDSTALRRSIKARSGTRVVKADLKQIECRMNAWFCGQLDLLDVFRRNGDPYSDLASDIFGRKINRKLPSDVAEGFIGKTGELGLGYGCGHKRFFAMVKADAHKFKINLKDLWTEQLAMTSVQTYRRKHARIESMWHTLGRIIETVWLVPGSKPVRVGPAIISYGRIDLPNGTAIHYDQPFRKVDEKGAIKYFYRYGKRVRRMHGPLMLENIVQALSRIVCMDAALRIATLGYPFKLQEHDALAWPVPENEVDKAKEIITKEMTVPPAWALTIPLGVDIGDGPNYGEAK
jgi:DNA polymerase bacteriophage-type